MIGEEMKELYWAEKERRAGSGYLCDSSAGKCAGISGQ
jgi:hypothetical protein